MKRDDRSMTNVLEELRLRSICPLEENRNRKASPNGKAVEELEFDINLISVFRGRRNASNAFLLISHANLAFSLGRSSEVKEPDIMPLVSENEGQRDR